MDKELLFHFFECYFHQDWRDDYLSSFDALNDFFVNLSQNVRLNLNKHLSIC